MKKAISQLMSFSEKNARSVVIAIVLLTVLGGIFYSYYLGNTLRFPDEEEYYILANNLVSEKIFSFNGKDKTAYLQPGYPFLLSVFISLGASIIHLRILNFIALGISIYLLYLIVKKYSSEAAGLLAAVLVICYPVLIYLAGLLVAQTIGTTMLLFILYLLGEEKDLPAKAYIFSALIFGYLILMIPSFIFSLLVISLCIFIFSNKGRLKKPIILIATTMLVVSIWSFRNYSVFNTYIFISTHSGMILLDGNSEATTPNSGSKADSEILSQMPKDLNEVEKDRYLKSKAIEYMLNNKMRTVKMYFLKALNHFNVYNELRVEAGIIIYNAVSFQSILLCNLPDKNSLSVTVQFPYDCRRSYLSI
jgi:4-amino-4-deoxy-L-arabinose transferase-like glycosyltransferase